jgi:transmembrane sensor
MNTPQRNPSAPRRAARAEAAAWVARIHGPSRTPALEAAFKKWLAESADNAREFENVTEVWDAAKLVRTGGMPREGRWPRLNRSTRGALAATVFLTFGLAAFSAYQLWLADQYSTRVGEQRLLRLPDGTRISLNSDSRLEVEYDKAQRRVQLKRGEAYFEVAKARDRPFIVVAGTREVTALGTAFVVRYEKDQTAVTLVEGKVVVTPSGTDLTNDVGTPGIALAPGQRLTLAAQSTRLDQPRIEAVIAWRRGEVVLDKTPLTEAIAEMNRYDEVKLVIASPEVGRLQVSGMYQTGDNIGFAQTVGKLYGLRVVERVDEIHLTGKPIPIRSATP